MIRKFDDEVMREIFFGYHPDYTTVVEDPWSDEKYSSATNIVEDKEGLCWRIKGFRSGSSYTYWDYDWEGPLVQVRVEKESKVIVVERWVEV